MYCISSLNTTITSCSSLDEKRVATTVNNSLHPLTDGQDGIASARITKRPSDGLFQTPVLLHSKQYATDNRSMKDTHSSQKIEAASSGKAVRVWHHRTGHASISTIQKMVQTGIHVMLYTDIVKTQDCLSCTHAKQTGNRYNKNLIVKQKLIEMHVEISGPIGTFPCG